MYIYFSMLTAAQGQPRDDTAQIKRKSYGFLWCIPR